MSRKMKEKIAWEMIRRVSETGDLSQVSVFDLCRDLNISRTSFYRNFRDKYDLIDWIFNVIVVNPVYAEGQNTCYYNRALHSLKVIDRYRSFFRTAMDYHGQNAFEQTYFNAIVTGFEERMIQKLGRDLNAFEKDILLFNTAGIVRIVSDWLRDGCRKGPEEICKKLIRLLPDSLLKIIW